MLDYPGSFDADAAKILIESDSGIGDHSVKEVRLATWNMIGYVQGQQDSAVAVPAAERTASKITTKAVAMKHLEEMTKTDASASRKIDWSGLLTILLGLLGKLTTPA